MINEHFKDMKLIPLHSNSKIPSVKWGTNDVIPFNGKETGYAIDTERSHLVVIDCDNKNDGINGVINFFNLVENYENKDMPETFTVQTPNHGVHFYYKVKTGSAIKNSVSKLAPGVDVRANGGYIVGPGSLVKDNEGNIKEYIVMNDDLIADLPEWLYKKLSISNVKVSKNVLKIKEQSESNIINEFNMPTSGLEEIEQKNSLNWALDKIMSATIGTRNDVLNHTAYFMGVKKVNRIEAEKLINEAINIGLGEEEAINTFEKAYERGLLEDNIPLDSIIKEYNANNSISFKDDPMDTEFYSHLSLSYNFWKKYRNELLFWESDSSWYKYNTSTGTWQKTQEDQLRAILKEFLEDLVNNIRKSKVNKISSSVYRAQEKLWSKITVDSVLVFARSDFLNLDYELFDSELEFVNCKNGVFNLKTGKVIPHDRNFYITRCIPYNINIDCTDPYCDKILESIHPDEKEYFQLFAGQSLTGYQPNSQVISFLFGRGSNGKSTIIDLLLRTGGSYSKLQPPSILQPTDGREIYALADFEGLRTVIVEELPDSKQLNSGSLKRLVGTEKINARQIYGHNREFINQSTIFVSCNRLPMVNETDDGTWRRLLVFNFPYSYKKNKTEIKSKWDKLGDPMAILAARKNTTTAEAFLAWRIKGAMRWVQDIHCERYIPQHIEETITEWNENNDLFLAWFNDNIKKETDSFILLQDAFESFNQWVTKRGHPSISLRFFINSFTNHKTFFDSQAKYISRAGVLKKYHQSYWTDEKGIIKRAGKKDSYFVNLSFIN